MTTQSEVSGKSPSVAGCSDGAAANTRIKPSCKINSPVQPASNTATESNARDSTGGTRSSKTTHPANHLEAVGFGMTKEIDPSMPSVEQHSSGRQEVLTAATQPLSADMSHLSTTIHPKRNCNQIDGVCTELSINTGVLMMQ